MKIRVIKTLAIDFKRHQPGAVIDVADADLAGRLIAAGFASESLAAAPIETATDDTELETATAPTYKGKGRRK
jgi:hypothetical protein